jgi:tripartite-type tricarboxylate transporter receptor subunit TctC
VADALSDRWGKPVIVDNRPGAGTIIGTEIVARAPADGHTLLINTGAFVINPSLRPTMPYDAFKDFAPVTLLGSTPLVLVVNSSSAAKSLREFLDDARARPGKLSYGTAGPGTNYHIVGEMLKIAAAIDVTYIPYPGGAPAVTAVLGDHVSLVIATYPEVASHIAAGKLRALAIASPERVERLAGVPTLSESGFPDVHSTVWWGIVAPAGTPPRTIARIQSEVASVLALPGVREKLAAQEVKPIAARRRNSAHTCEPLRQGSTRSFEPQESRRIDDSFRWSTRSGAARARADDKMNA